MAEEFIATLSPSEINVTLTLERTVNEGGGGGVSSWNDLEDKPATFPPSTHNHDDIYYTDDEIDALIQLHSGQANSAFIPTINTYLLTSTQIGTGYGNAGISTTALNSNNKGKLTPFYLPKAITVDALALYCITANAGASAVLRLGIFYDNDGTPGEVAIDAGTASINSTGMKTLTFTPVVLPRGRYFACAVTQNLDTAGTNPTFACTGVAAQTIGDPTPSASNNMFSNAAFSDTGALDANPTITVSRTLYSSCPHIFMRRVA